MKRCPACQKEFADKVMHCVYDGSKLQPVPAPAGTLSYLISSAAPLPVKSALRIAISLCDALEAIHRAGRVVGALRPRNIFVANYPPVDGHPPVVQIEEKATADKAHRIEGATAYLAPEVKRAQAADVRSDVYSVGAILREMLYGQFGRNLAERARPTIPAALLEIIERATHENPSARHDSIAALEVELQAALQRFERAAASPAAAKPKTRFEGRDTDSLLGQIIAGRYRLLAKLGQSSMGTVFKSESATLNRPVAINVFPAELSQDAAFVARFQSEAQAATRVKHPHVAAIHDFGITRDGYAYLVSELVEGESLHDVLEREGPLPPSRAMDILRQTAEAVDAMHKVKATHRSLKPSRIMLKRVDRRADYVKVLGFSMFRMMPRVTASNLTPAGVVIAAPEYMAPEQLAGEAVDARCDIYSLAVIFYEMLTGRLPFDGNSLQVRAVRQMMGEPTPLRAVLPRAGRRVEAAVMKGLARRPEDRYATVMDFMRALEAAGRAEAMDQLDGVERVTGSQSRSGGLMARLSAFLKIPESHSGSLLAAESQAPPTGRLKKRAVALFTNIGLLFILAIALGLISALLAAAMLNVAALIVLAIAAELWVWAVIVLVHRLRKKPLRQERASVSPSAQLQSEGLPPVLPHTQEARQPLAEGSAASAQSPAAPEATKRCPTCQTTLPLAARFCVLDGTPVGADRIKESESRAALNKLCRKCGGQYAFTKKYCPRDGEPLVATASAGRVGG